jgi:hypothetical protein
MANDIVAIAARMKIIVFTSLEAGTRLSVIGFD